MMPLIYLISGILIIDIFVQIFQNSLNNRFEKSPINLFFTLSYLQTIILLQIIKRFVTKRVKGKPESMLSGFFRCGKAI